MHYLVCTHGAESVVNYNLLCGYTTLDVTSVQQLSLRGQSKGIVERKWGEQGIGPSRPIQRSAKSRWSVIVRDYKDSWQ